MDKNMLHSLCLAWRGLGGMVSFKQFISFKLFIWRAQVSTTQPSATHISITEHGETTTLATGTP